MDFDYYFKSLKKLNTKKTNFHDILQYILKYDNFDIISYKQIININSDNIKYNNNKYYFEYKLDRLFDIATNFQINSNNNDNIKISLIIKNSETFIVIIDENTKIIPICAIYSDFVIRIIFDNEPKDFVFSYDAYISQNDVRLKLIESHVIITHNVECDTQYKNGIINIYDSL